MHKNLFYSTLFTSFAFVLFAFNNPDLKNPEKENSNAEVKTAEPTVSLSTKVYESMNLSALGIAKEAIDYAVRGYEKLVEQGVVLNDQYISIVDFSQSSRSKRFYLLDLKNNKVIKNTFVSHGRNSGLDYAEKFSNRINSNQSSLGFYITKDTYTGKHGKSLRLAGLEEGFNDNAEDRAIVVHGADYVNPGRVNSGYMGRSQGCPALSQKDYAEVIDLIKDGTVMFVYHPSAEYLQQSALLN